MGQVEMSVNAFISAHENSDDRLLIIALTQAAGAIAARLQKTQLEIVEKTSQVDLVTNADKIIESFVSEVLHVLRPNDGVLGEERVSRESSSGRYWVVDPIDGTFNYANHLDHFCSAIALVEGNPQSKPDVELGAIFRPSSSELWVGGHHTPSTKNRISIEGTRTAAKTLATYLHPTYLEDPEVFRAWQCIVRNFANVRMLGSSSIDLALVAQNTFTAWMQRDTKAWDWLPGKGIIQGAGLQTQVIRFAEHDWFVAGQQHAVEAIARYLRA